MCFDKRFSVQIVFKDKFGCALADQSTFQQNREICEGGLELADWAKEPPRFAEVDPPKLGHARWDVIPRNAMLFF